MCQAQQENNAGLKLSQSMHRSDVKGINKERGICRLFSESLCEMTALVGPSLEERFMIQ